MSETIYNIPLRKKEYEVHVEDSAGPATIMWFDYNHTKMIVDVYIPDDLDFQEINKILTIKVRDKIYKYNRRRYERSARYNKKKDEICN